MQLSARNQIQPGWRASTAARPSPTWNCRPTGCAWSPPSRWKR